MDFSASASGGSRLERTSRVLLSFFFLLLLFLCLSFPSGRTWGSPSPPAAPRGHGRPPPPLRGERRHYLPLWNNEDPYGDIWVAEQPPARVDVDGKARGEGR